MNHTELILCIFLLIIIILCCSPRKENFTIKRKKISNINYYKGYPDKGLYIKDLNKVEKFCKNQGNWHDNNFDKINYHVLEEINLNSIEHCVSGPSRPQDRIKLNEVKKTYGNSLNSLELKNKAFVLTPYLSLADLELVL